MKLICLPLFNGMCNRLIPIASALRLAEKSGRKVKVFWTCNPGRSLLTYWGESVNFEELFEPVDGLEFLSMEDINKYLPSSDDYNCKIIKPFPVVNLSTEKHIFIVYCINFIFSGGDATSSQYTLLEAGKFVEDTFWTEIKGFFRRFRPISNLKNEIDRVYEAKMRGKNMVGLHIRRTDGSFAEKDWRSTDQALLMRACSWAHDGFVFFLATDSIEHEKKYREALGNSLVTYNPPFDKFKNDKNNVLAAVVDLYLLSMCNRAIIGTVGSSFSVTAALLSEKTPFWMISENCSSVSKIYI